MPLLPDLARSVQRPHPTTGRLVRLQAPVVFLEVASSVCCHKTADSSASSPASSLVSFVASRRISFSDALPRWEFECKLSNNVRSWASAAAEVRGDPIVKLGHFVGSVIHEGNPPMLPSGNSQKMYSPFGSFALR